MVRYNRLSMPILIMTMCMLVSCLTVIAIQSSEQQHPKEKDSSSWLDGYQPPDKVYIPQASSMGEENDLLSNFQKDPLLQIPCSVAHGGKDADGATVPVSCFCDTGLQRSIMSWEVAQKCGLAPLLQQLENQGTSATTITLGSGSTPSNIAGRLPAGVFSLHLFGSNAINSPAFIVLESKALVSGIGVLLGLDFLREHDAIIDLKQDELELILSSKESAVRIPFIRPRGRMTLDSSQNYLKTNSVTNSGAAGETGQSNQDKNDNNGIGKECIQESNSADCTQSNGMPGI